MPNARMRCARRCQCAALGASPARSARPSSIDSLSLSAQGGTYVMAGQLLGRFQRKGPTTVTIRILRARILRCIAAPSAPSWPWPH
jgi:hypothetical protein